MINFALQKYFLSKKGLFCSGLAWRKLYRRSNNDRRNERVGQRCLRRYDTGSFLPSVVPDLNQKSFSVLFPEIVTNISNCLWKSLHKLLHYLWICPKSWIIFRFLPLVSFLVIRWSEIFKMFVRVKNIKHQWSGK